MSVEPRETLRDALRNFLSPEQLTRLIDEVLAIEKRAPGEFVCKKRGQKQRQYTSILDAKAVALALPDLSTSPTAGRQKQVRRPSR
jgi:hypothetical protein